MSDDDRPRCGYIKDSGEPCESPVVDQSGRCPAHRPGGEQEMRERASRGGQAAAEARRSGPEVLDPEELGELDSYADAKRWLTIVARGVLSGAIDQSRANAATRALTRWVSAHESEIADEKLAELERRLEQIEAGGDGRPPGSWGPGAGG